MNATEEEIAAAAATVETTLLQTGDGFDANEAGYVTQVAVYAEAVGNATKLPAQAILFVV